MSYDSEKCLTDAEKLLDSRDLQDVISLKIEPEPKRMCCCSDCWPLVWQDINDFIQPQGPVDHEGRAVVEIEGEKYVLEQHESGPEILLIVTASINVIAAVINLIVAVCNSLRRERKCPKKIKIVKRRLLHKRVVEEVIVELSLDDSELTQEKIKKIIKAAIKNTPVSKKH